MKNVIIIPIYKKEINSNELISLKQCFRVLGDHMIIFVAPNNLDVRKYEEIVQKPIIVERFSDEYFLGISSYNSLMLSKEFYERFIDYNYMLIYQLDCYVFKDEFEYWCNKGYDYIGAPWLFHEYFNFSFKRKCWVFVKGNYDCFVKKTLTRKNIYLKVGNGGFSLRNIKKFIIELENNPNVSLFMSDDNTSLYNEDVFWSLMTKSIKKPNYKIGSKFSLDPGADIGYQLNKNVLPFGCHAWDRDVNFWKKFIDL